MNRRSGDCNTRIEQDRSELSHKIRAVLLFTKARGQLPTFRSQVIDHQGSGPSERTTKPVTPVRARNRRCNGSEGFGWLLHHQKVGLKVKFHANHTTSSRACNGWFKLQR